MRLIHAVFAARGMVAIWLASIGGGLFGKRKSPRRAEEFEAPHELRPPVWLRNPASPRRVENSPDFFRMEQSDFEKVWMRVLPRVERGGDNLGRQSLAVRGRC